MRFTWLIAILLTAWATTAQVDPKNKMPDHPVNTRTQPDSVSSNQQLQKKSDMKTMDAVKTQDHPKSVRKEKSKARHASKNTIKTRKSTRSQ